jgi:DNA polymerase-3 subunit delta
MSGTLQGYKKLFEGLSRRKFHRLYLLYGDEEFMKKEFLSGLIRAVLPGENRVFNLDIFYGDEFDRDAFDDRMNSFPLFADNRMVIVKKFDALSVANKDHLIETTGRIPDSLTLVVESSASKPDNARLKKLKTIADSKGLSFRFQELSEKETIDRVRSRIEKEGCRIDEDALALLVESVGTGLMDLSNEVEKILMTVAKGETIDKEKVEAVVGKYRVESVFAFLDSMKAESLGRTVKSISRLIDAGEEPVFLMAMLIRRVLLLMQMKALSQERREGSRGTGRPETEINPYIFRIVERQAGFFEYEELDLLLENLIWADALLKSSKIEPRIVLEEAFLAFSLRKRLAWRAG